MLFEKTNHGRVSCGLSRRTRERHSSVRNVLKLCWNPDFVATPHRRRRSVSLSKDRVNGLTSQVWTRVLTEERSNERSPLTVCGQTKPKRRAQLISLNSPNALSAFARFPLRRFCLMMSVTIVLRPANARRWTDCMAVMSRSSGD